MRTMVRPLLLAATVLSIVALVGIGNTPAARQACAAEEQVSFSQDILPLLQWRCVSCHQAPDGKGFKKSGVDLTSYEGLMKGTKYVSFPVTPKG